MRLDWSGWLLGLSTVGLARSNFNFFVDSSGALMLLFSDFAVATGEDPNDPAPPKTSFNKSLSRL
jgi:hypothetical protein